MKRIISLLVLALAATSASAQFAPNQVLRSADLNAALAGPTITSGTINGARVGTTNPTTVRATTVESTVTTGTPPFIVASTTLVPNLHAATAGSIDSVAWASPGTIGSTTPNTGAFTTLSATGQITSTVTTGTAPFTVASTTNVANLNASSLNGATFAAPGTIGGGTAAAGIFTSLNYSTTVTGGTGVVNLGSNQFYKDASGLVGLGKVPGFQLDVASALTGTTVGSNVLANFESQASGRDAEVRFGDTVNASKRIGYLSGAMYFATGTTENARLSPAGRLLLNTTTDDGASQLQSVKSTAGASLMWSNAGSTPKTGYLYSGAAAVGFFDDPGAAGNGFYINGGTHAFIQIANTNILDVSAGTALVNGVFGVGATTGAKFTVGGATSGTSALADSMYLSSYSTTPQLRWTFNHAGSGTWGIGSDGVSAMIFGKSTAGGNGAVTNEYARFSAAGNWLVNQTSDDGVNKFQMSGGAKILAGNVSASNAAEVLSLTSTTGTNDVDISLTNTGGTYYYAVEKSSGASFGATAYALVRYAPAGRVIQDIIAGTGVVNTTSSSGFSTSALLDTGAHLIISSTAPTIASGFGTSPSITANNTAAFKITVGSSPGGTGVITLPTAPNGWAVTAVDVTNNATIVVSQTATSTTSATVTAYARTTGLAGNFTASDVLLVQATAY